MKELVQEQDLREEGRDSSYARQNEWWLVAIGKEAPVAEGDFKISIDK